MSQLWFPVDLEDGSGVVRQGARLRFTDELKVPTPVPLYMPSGDASGAEDAGQLNELIAQEGGFQLGFVQPGGTPYYLDAPLVVQEDGVNLLGLGGYPFANNPPYRCGSVLQMVGAGAGRSVVVVQQAGAPTASLAGVTIRGLVFNGGGVGAGWGGFYVQGQKCRILSNELVAMQGDFVTLAQVGNPFPQAGYDVVVWDNGLSIGGGRGIYCQSATDSLIQGNRISQTALEGILVAAAGGQIIGNHIYTTVYPTGYAIRTLTAQDLIIVLNRCHSYQGGISVDGGNNHQSGLIVLGNTLQASTLAGDDNLIDAIAVTAEATLAGGSIGPNTFRNGAGSATRWRYGLNILSANVTGLMVGPIVDSHDGAVASAFGTGPLLDGGTGTRNFNALA